MLYQEERFKLLGHTDGDSDYLSNSNPASATAFALTGDRKNRDAAATELAAERGAVLLKNDSATLPLTATDFKKGVVVGSAAEYFPAEPGVERANGYYDRDAVSPLQQLKQYAPPGSKITYLPGFPSATASDGVTVPTAVLSTDGLIAGSGLPRRQRFRQQGRLPRLVDPVQQFHPEQRWN